MNAVSVTAAQQCPTMPKSKILQSIYLIYSLFYFFPLFFMGEYLAAVGIQWWLAVVAVYAAFIILYFWVIAKDAQNRRRFALAAMLLLATFGSELTPGTSAFFAYVTFFGVFFFSKKCAFLWCVATSLAIFFAAWFFVDFAWYFVIPAVFTSVLNIFTAGSEIHKFTLQRAAERTNQLEERERIAHDLHDVTGHHLTAITLKAQLAKRFLASGQYSAASDELDTIAELAGQNRAAIRNAIEGALPSDVSAMYLDLLSLIKAQGFEIVSSGYLPHFKADVAMDAAAIFTEGLTNALRHASEKTIVIAHTLTKEYYQWRITNTSDGQSGSKGIGLISMARRAKNMGGQTEFNVIDGNAQLNVIMPLAVIAC